MSNVGCLVENQHENKAGAEADRGPGFRHVLACVDSSPLAQTVIAHAAAVAAATGARITVMQVLEPPAPGEIPADPVAWGLRLREAEARLETLTADAGDELRTEAAILEGSPAEKICQWACDHDVDLAVLGTHGESSWTEGGLGSTARRVVELLPGSILLLPRNTPVASQVCYRRIMVPLDCSAQAEMALPVAVTLAGAHEADLILVHASPEVDLIEVGPPEAEDLELRDRLRRRNERVAHAYLRQVQARLFFGGGAVRIRLLSGDDPRHAIARAAIEERADVIVLSSSGGGAHADLPVGSVADYLITHIATPILVVRDAPALRRRLRHAHAAASPRLPSQALS